MDDPNQRIADMVDEALAQAGPAASEHESDADHEADGFDPGASDDIPAGVAREALARCAKLDASDTDNATRFIEHFGRDLCVVAQEQVSGGVWLGWLGTHWDQAGGAAHAAMLAQRVGDLIKLEAAMLRRAEKIGETEAEFEKRVAKRRGFGVTSKNAGRIAAMQTLAATRLRRPADDFNPNPLKVACATHTLEFVRTGAKVTIRAKHGHERDDLITSCAPVAWEGLSALAPKWNAFIERMQPDHEKRRTIQQFTGASLATVADQHVMFHWGRGANGKSVFIETISRVFGQGMAVSLPRETIVGRGEKGSGAAAPDLVRLFGKRFVAVPEIKDGEPLQEDLVKRLSGGDRMAVRDLFKGYFEFVNVAKAHLIGNGFPTIEGTDNGIWRRLLVVAWDQTVPEDERRDFEEFVSELVREEGPGILAWLARGLVDYLENGLVIAPSVRAATKEYREEMDPIGEFARMCLTPRDGSTVQANTAFQAYVSWSEANGKRARSQTKFGRVLGQTYRKKEIGGRLYYDGCELHDVPDRPSRNPDHGDGWRQSGDGSGDSYDRF